MKFNTLYKALTVASIVFSPLCLATEVDADFSFTTVPVVQINLVRDIVFPGDMKLSLGSLCTMLVDDTARPSEADAKISDVGFGEGPGVGYEVVSNDCSADPGTSTGTAGIYEVVGGSGVPVKITVNPFVGTDIKYTPAGLIANFDGLDSGQGDDFVVVDGSATERNVQLANNFDVTNGSGVPEAGTSRIILGGEIEALNALSAGTTYPGTFTIDVTY
jgi:hypothetical protein